MGIQSCNLDQKLHCNSFNLAQKIPNHWFKSIMGESTLKSPKIVVTKYSFLHFKKLTRCVHRTELDDNIVNFEEI